MTPAIAKRDLSGANRAKAGPNEAPDDHEQGERKDGATNQATPDDHEQRQRDQMPRYPFDFSALCEGDEDRLLKKKIVWLIDSDENYIVYLDEENYVEWNMNDNSMLGADTAPYLNMVARLEAVDVSNLTVEQVKSYRRMIAEGVARLFQKSLDAAKDAFTDAEKWVMARNTEVARRWYLAGSGGAALISLLAVSILGFWSSALRDSFGIPVYNILMGASMGGIGAWLSVVQRSRTTELDVAAGRLLHHLEGAFRIMVGTLGALLIALAIRAGLIAQVEHLSAIMVMCMVAGVSERLVPSFIEQVESRAIARNANPN
jgi:hypothetical protein